MFFCHVISFVLIWKFGVLWFFPVLRAMCTPDCIVSMVHLTFPLLSFVGLEYPHIILIIRELTKI